MGKLRWAAGALLAILLLTAGAMMVASEQGGEIVTLETIGADGFPLETRLWIVEDAGALWLRAGLPSSGWLVRIDHNHIVELERAGRRTRYRAVSIREPATRDRIHALMREKYGLADRWISLLRDGAGSVPVRLDAVVPAASP